MFTDNSDYIVEQYIKPNKVRKRLINDERADLLGNFDDDDSKFTKKRTTKTKTKTKPIVFASEEDPFTDDAVDESEDEQINGDKNDKNDEPDSSSDSDSNGTAAKSEAENSDSKNASDKAEISEMEEETPQPKTTKAKQSNRKPVEKAKKSPAKTLDLTDEQIQALIRGSSKKDRFVIYITNLNYSTTREALTEFFEAAGQVKSVRVPKVRRSAFAFVEMSDISGFKVCIQQKSILFLSCVVNGFLFSQTFQNALTFHNRTLDNYTIKVQISEAGKKKSANKKNILKQKNRKLAEMRNETKQFQRSGKGYDKTLKKEIQQQKMQQNRRLARKQKSTNKKQHINVLDYYCNL